jgi:hypothetical protein
MSAQPTRPVCPRCGKLYTFPCGDECQCPLEDDPTSEEAPPPYRGGSGGSDLGVGMLALTALAIGAMVLRRRR